MLALAIKSRIPIIRATTSDLLNLPDVLEFLAPDMKTTIVQGQFPSKGDLLYSVSEYPVSRTTYESLADANRVLILFKQEPSPFAFDVGEVPVPRPLMEDLLQQAFPKGKVADLLPCFN